MFSGLDKPKPRGKDAKKVLDVEDGQKRRQDQNLTLRKSKRDDILSKKRRDVPSAAPGSGAAPLVGSAENPPGMHGLEDSSNSMNPETNTTSAWNKTAGVGAHTIPELVKLIQSTDRVTKHAATHQFRKLLSMESNPPITEVIQAEDGIVVRRLVEFLSENDDPNLQFEAAWALTNIASGTADHTRAVIQEGSVPKFLELLSSPAEEVREQSVWALGNIAGDSHRCRDYVLGLNGLLPLLAIVQSNPKQTMMRNATWTISNLCRGKPIPELERIAPALDVLARLLWHSDEEVMADACWAISYVSDGPNERIEAVLKLDVVGRLIELLSANSTAIQTPALRTIGNIVTGTDAQTQIVINKGGLTCLKALLEHPKRSIKKEACWTLSNITAGSPNQVQAVIDADIIPPLLRLLRTGDFEVRKEAAWAISNATSSGTTEHLQRLVDEGVIAPLVELLATPDTKVVDVALEGLENILRTGQELYEQHKLSENPYAVVVEEMGGVDYLESLQCHQSNKIYERAVCMLETFFEVSENEENEGVEQPAGSTAFSFGGGEGAPLSFN